MLGRNNLCPIRFFMGNSGLGNNWASGFYTEGSERTDEDVDHIRKENWVLSLDERILPYSLPPW